MNHPVQVTSTYIQPAICQAPWKSVRTSNHLTTHPSTPRNFAASSVRVNAVGTVARVRRDETRRDATRRDALSRNRVYRAFVALRNTLQSAVVDKDTRVRVK